MKKLFGLAMAIMMAASAQAQTAIAIQNPYSPSHSATPAFLKIIEVANQSQSDYKFVLEYKPGGNQAIALKQLDQEPQSRLAVIAPAFVENAKKGLVDKNNYVPVHALGDACWAVISNKGNERDGVASLKGEKEIIVGGVGFGNATHLTSLAIGERLGFQVKYIVFKSNNDALVNMTGNNGVNFLIDKVDNLETFKQKNPSLNILAASCPNRLPGFAQIKTLKEQGYTTPYIFNITVAHQSMPAAQRERIGKILTDATVKVGEAEIYRLSGMRPPVFDRVSAEQFYRQSTDLVGQLLTQYDQYIPKQ
jgi:tripartite-type tricarboxylate transporter receptor subunit TctC